MTKVQHLAIWNTVAWIVLAALVTGVWHAYPYVVAALKYLF
jgi:hypothetical protein